MTGTRVVLYDGYCKFCSRTVRWVKHNDPRGRFSFRPLQDKDLYDAGLSGDTVVLLDNGKRYERSAAAIRIAMGLRFPWPLMGVLLIVPPFIRDGAYNVVARNRKRWFGVHKTCYLPED